MRQNDETGVNFPHGLSVIVANFLFKLFNGLRYFFEKVFVCFLSGLAGDF